MTVPRFWREIPQRYNLQASVCGVCKDVHFPPRDICPKCRRESIGQMRSENLKGLGRIVEWTRVYKSAPGFEDQVPYVIALIQAEEGPVMTGQVVDSAADVLRPGAWVQAVFRRLGQDGDDGVIYYGTKWKVVADPPALPTADDGDGKKRKK